MSDLYWSIAPGVRAELHVYTGLNFAGTRTIIRVFHDQRKQGPEIDGSRVKSIALSAPFGTRAILCAGPESNWQDAPWRALVFTADGPFKLREGLPVIQVPDLDAMDGPSAVRHDPDVWSGYPLVARPEDGKGWTYGKSMAGRELKGTLRGIRLEKL